MTDDACSDPIATLTRLFVDASMGRRLRGGQSPVLRPVFTKPHGVVHGTLRVVLPDAHPLRAGLFAGGPYETWVRFSSDTQPMLPDLRSTLGIALKLFGVTGPNLLDGEPTGTADLIFQFHDVFFVQDARAMCEFTHAGLETAGGYDQYLAEHPDTKAVLDAMSREAESVLTETYWSIIPFAHGEGNRPVKYKLAPLGAQPKPSRAHDTIDPNYLALDLADRLQQGPARFGLYLQPQLDESTMPLDRAMERWSEAASPPILAAELTLDAGTPLPGQQAYGENLSFNVWRTLEAHQPLGSIAEARRAIYRESANQRRMRNGIPTTEPSAPRPTALRELTRDTTIVRAKIHPAIGVARVGNSEEFFLGPEVPDPPPPDPGSRRDRTGRLKRQAARFRIYGYNKAGEAIRELTAAEAGIRWDVHLANRKAEWFEFQLAQDIPEASRAPVSHRRNASVSDRASLVIDPGARQIEGKNAGGPKHDFDSGSFLGVKVPLGGLRTDEAGRLIVLGGFGRSSSPRGISLQDFANNDGWHDDVSDGPVRATVMLDGKPIPVDPAWVVVAPPDYAPPLKSVRTLWDLLTDLNIQWGTLSAPARVSYGRDIHPLLMRMRELGWANAGFAETFGPGGFVDLHDRERLRRLASPADEDAPLRRLVLHAFRAPDASDPEPGKWPWLYGDATSLEPPTARENATVTATQYAALQAWARGAFDPDLEAIGARRALEERPVAEQPGALDRAALDHCLADAFHPGCEVTWPMRQRRIYMAPYRVRHRAANLPEPELGAVFQTAELERFNGVFWGQIPGGLTRWMAVPWQSDTASCRSGYTRDYDPYLPSFWPARVPNQVLSEESYQAVMDRSKSREERLAAFRTRADWFHPLPGAYFDQVQAMVEHFWKLGVLEARPGPGELGLPERFLVESLPGEPALAPAPAPAVERAKPPAKEDRAAMRAFRRVQKDG